jgi:hypothetical protein
MRYRYKVYEYRFWTNGSSSHFSKCVFVVCSLQAERECEGAGQAGQRVDDDGSSALRL